MVLVVDGSSGFRALSLRLRVQGDKGFGLSEELLGCC